MGTGPLCTGPKAQTVEIRHLRKTTRLLRSGRAPGGRWAGDEGCWEGRGEGDDNVFAEPEEQNEEAIAWTSVIVELESPFHDQLWWESKPSGWSLCYPLTAARQRAGCLISLDLSVLPFRMQLRTPVARRVWL